MQWVQDLVLSLQWFGSLLWRGLAPCPWELPHAEGVAKKKKTKKKQKEKRERKIHMTPARSYSG